MQLHVLVSLQDREVARKPGNLAEKIWGDPLGAPCRGCAPGALEVIDEQPVTDGNEEGRLRITGSLNSQADAVGFRRITQATCRQSDEPEAVHIIGKHGDSLLHYDRDCVADEFR